ncbi:AbrB family transcriptional regulator [Campylobacter geochelonis]|uniref:AbrB family transcriptional regulator n=1 Tax=Campylobacter geochelonis TaxID=1780362 RepID=UPI000770B7CD|nr:AbrB family transcriptional regulator [Campylobacter geochelonis]CZE46982.1 Putative ammonia monooxygenase [Campylobacter geochelonis]
MLYLKYLLTIFIGFLGGFSFSMLNMPLPWLLGPIVSVMIATRFLDLVKPTAVINSARATLGIIIGSAFTPQIIALLPQYIFSLLMLVPMVLVLAVFGVYYYEKVMKFDRITAFFSSIPGGILEMILIAKDCNADIKKVALSQSIRVLFLIFFLPLVVAHFTTVNINGNFAITQKLIDTSFSDMILMILAGVIGVKIALKLNLVGAYIVGSMVVSSIFYMCGFIHSKPPDEVIKLAQIVLGSSIGFAFYKISIREVVKNIAATFGYFIGISLICAGFIFLMAKFSDFPLLSIILAFSPGGQSEVNMIAITLATDIPYIAIHHLFRVFFITGVLPNLVKKL